MKIEIWSDYVCPFCYIAKRKLERALEDFPNKDKIEIVYRAYQLSPDALEYPSKIGYEAFAEEKGIDIMKAKEMYGPVTNFAKQYDLYYQTDKLIMSNTMKAHRLTKLASGTKMEKEFVDALYNAHFERALNISDNDTLVEIATKYGLDKERVLEVLNSDEYKPEVLEDISLAKELGVTGVPFFVFNQKYAIYGAQRDEVFKDTLIKAYNEFSNNKNE